MVFLKSSSAWLALLALLCGRSSIRGASTSWTNSDSSSWALPANWSAGTLPDSSLDVLITNAGTKSVLLDPGTPANHRAARALTIRGSAGATNTLRIQGLPSSEPFTTSGTFTIGSGGAAHVTNSTVRIGNTFDVNGSLYVDSGLVDSASSFVGVRVGRVAGASGTVDLNGGLLDCFGFRLGLANTASGTCVIDGGTLRSSSVVSLGETLNSGGSLWIRSGQLVATNDITKVGNLSPGTLAQDGGTSDFAFLSVGDNAPGTMTVSGGLVTVTPRTESDLTRIGNFGDAELNVTGGDVWLRGEFHVADNPGVTGRVLLSGGNLASTNALVAIGRYGIGELTVTNANAWLTNTSVGRHDGSTGTLNLQPGGTVYCEDDLSIGRFANATGYAVVTGGLLSLENENLWVGREGTGSLYVSNGTVAAESLFVGMSHDGTNTPHGTVVITGGKILLSSNAVVGTELVSTGELVVAGGRLEVGNPLGTGWMAVQNGTVTMSDGLVSADSLVLTNGAGQFNLVGGRLKVRDMIVANGAPFVVGDGVSPAVLEIAGGTIAFADGLVISPNASVTGCGTIAGPLTNNGSLGTNCSVGVVISSVARSGETVRVGFPSVSGLTHFLEFKEAITDAAWSTIPPGLPGNGAPASLQDPAATNAHRFYRIRSE